MAWFSQREKACPKAEDSNGPVIGRQKASGTGFGLAIANGECAGIEVNLPPFQKA
jgi:hypothetical protein